MFCIENQYSMCIKSARICYINALMVDSQHRHGINEQYILSDSKCCIDMGYTVMFKLNL